MLVSEIKSFAAKVAADEAFGGKNSRVVIKVVKDGQTLYIGWDGKFSATDKKDAVVYRYDDDKVGDQLFQCIVAGMPVQVESYT
jgi:hypothetical protein